MEITADSHGARLAGSVWMPAGDAVAGVLMHPGSGPSNRDNDVLFPPIRNHLLAARIAVCSFDKRGVGGSSGRWQDAGIGQQTDDLLAGLASFAAHLAAIPIGLFGHSQGGWVVIEAAGRGAPIAFVITNSGPAVSPAQQERYRFSRLIPEALPAFDAVVTALRQCRSLGDGLDRLTAAGVDHSLLTGYEELFEDDAAWRFTAELFQHEPATALSQVTVPLLAVYGAQDQSTPVDKSIAALRNVAPPDLVEVAVFPDVGHRLQHGDPARFADGYLERLSAFIRHERVPPAPADDLRPALESRLGEVGPRCASSS